jgi:hypothetical protein
MGRVFWDTRPQIELAFCRVLSGLRGPASGKPTETAVPLAQTALAFAVEEYASFGSAVARVSRPSR